MSCTCYKAEGSKTTEILHTQGNILRMILPITRRETTVTDGISVDTDTSITPINVVVELTRGEGEVFNFEATIEDNVIYIEDKGTLPLGVYSITVLFQDVQGNPYRYKKNAVLRIVDTTLEGGSYANDEVDIVAYYPVIEGRSSAIVITDDAIYLETGGKFGADDDGDDEATLYTGYGDGSVEETEDEVVLYI